MNDKLNQTQRILRSPKVTTDDRGRTVWVDTVDTANLELMSTQMLKQIIDSNDVEAKDKLRSIAEGENGLVARGIDENRFEVISDEELQRILDGTDTDSGAEGGGSFPNEAVDETVSDEEEMELVSTQMLRIALNLVDDEESAGGGFDPYNKD